MAYRLTDGAGITADPIGDTEERAELRRSLRRLIDRESPPDRIAELDEAEVFDHALHRHIAELGVLALGGPKEHGGVGDARDQIVAVEELAAGPSSMAAFLILQFMTLQVLGGHGTTDEHHAVLRALLAGDVKVAFALSEPDGGTDIARVMRTRARKDGSDWVINGHKTWITAATIADHLIVIARTGEGATPVDGVTMFLVPADAPGLTSRDIPTLGLRSVPTCDVHFDDVRVPGSAVIGDVGKGFRSAFATLNRERLNSAAATLGGGRAALEAAVSYAREREAFGQRIGAFQALQHRLVDGALALESARSLMVRAAEVEVAGGRADLLAASAKVVSSEAAVKVTQDGMYLMAGAGYSRLTQMQRWFRDVRLWTFAPMSNEMSRNYLGERLLGLPRSY